MAIQPHQYENGASGFVGGLNKSFNDFVVEPEKERVKSKLALQMESKRLEMENAASMQKAQFSQNLNQIPEGEMASIGTQTGAVLNAIKNGGAIPTVDFSGLQTVPGQQAALKTFGELATAMTARQKMNKPVAYRVPDPQTGKIVTKFIDPYTQEVVATMDGGYSHEAENRIAGGRAAYFNMRNYADTTEKQISQFITANNGLSALAQKGLLTLNQITQSDPKAKAFIDNLGFSAATLDKRVLGSIKSGGQALQEKTAGAILNPGDTWPVVQQKMALLREAAVDQVKSAYQTHGVPMPSDIPELAQQEKPVAPEKAAGPTLSAADFSAWRSARNAPKPKQ